MILESLQKIKKAETEAKERIENAKGDVVSIIKTAKTEGEKFLAERMRNAQSQEEKMRDDAVEEARKECKNVANEWKKETESLKKEAQKNLGKAKEFILRSLLG
jgi:ATP synthase H subunit